jgi:hypothetical protein
MPTWTTLILIVFVLLVLGIAATILIRQRIGPFPPGTNRSKPHKCLPFGQRKGPSFEDRLDELFAKSWRM